MADAADLDHDGPGAAGLGGLPGVLDALDLGAEDTAGAAATFEFVSLQLSISLVQATGTVLPLGDVPSGQDLAGADATAQRLADFATGLFDTFAAQRPDLSRQEALAEFEIVARDAIDAGFADAADALEGLGRLDAETAQLLTDIRNAVAERLDAFFSTEGAAAAGQLPPGTAGPGAADGADLPTAQSFGITRVEQVSLSVSLQVARARIETRAAEDRGDAAPTLAPVDLSDARDFDESVGALTALADELFDRLLAGDDLFGDGGLQGLVDRVLDIVGRGFDDAFRILDDFGAALLDDGSPVQGVFAAAFQSVELNISRTRIETADGLVVEQTSLSLRVVQVRIQVAVGADLADAGAGATFPVPESPEDVAQNVLDFASGLFGAFRAQNPDLDDEHALADFVALTRAAAARGADEARELLGGLDELDDRDEDGIAHVLSALDALLAERFPQAAGLLT